MNNDLIDEKLKLVWKVGNLTLLLGYIIGSEQIQSNEGNGRKVGKAKNSYSLIPSSPPLLYMSVDS